MTNLGNCIKSGLIAAGVLAVSAHAGIGQDAADQVTAAATEANIVYVAVIAALAAYFVVKLIRRAL